MIDTILHGDCLELMKDIPDGSIDMILCDLPYGATQNKWDSVIPFELLWRQYERIIKPNGAIVLTASQPFTSALVMSNAKLFKHEWIWEKNRATGHLNAKKAPMKAHESVLVFYKKPPVYNPQKTTGHKPANFNRSRKKETTNYGSFGKLISGGQTDRYPRSVQKFHVAQNIEHPTQKPVALFEYLIKTYSNAGDVVLDNCAGSGTTGIACININRKYILMERDPTYCSIANRRIMKLLNSDLC